MNLVTKNVRASLKSTGLLILASLCIVGCDTESNNARKSMAIYQGEDTAVNAKNEGVTVQDNVPTFDVYSAVIKSELSEEELKDFKPTVVGDELTGDEKSGQEIIFDFSLTDKTLTDLDNEQAQALSIAFYSKDDEGKLTKQITTWKPLDSALIEAKSDDNKTASFSFIHTANDYSDVIKLKEELRKITRDRNESSADEGNQSEFMNIHMAFSIDNEKILKSIDLKPLCKDFPGNFNNKDTRNDGCNQL